MPGRELAAKVLVLVALMLGASAFRPWLVLRTTKRASAVRRSLAAMPTASSSPLPSLPRIELLPEEAELFDMFRRMVKTEKLNTTVRVAGGWVRDKLLGRAGKNDIDIALDNMTGAQFALKLNEWSLGQGGAAIQFGVIQQNPDKSKHLETATAMLGKFAIDFVNLRTEEYTSTSRIPEIRIGTPEEDALRRDLTINALFYNVNSGTVEDFTGRGIKDLAARVVQTPLPALTTLEDDPLRALRAIRFACRFQFLLAPELVAACQQPSVAAALGAKVSRERVFQEVEQMLAGVSSARAAFLLHRLGLDKLVLALPQGIMIAPIGSGVTAGAAPVGTTVHQDLEVYHSRGVANLLCATVLSQWAGAGSDCPSHGKNPQRGIQALFCASCGTSESRALLNFACLTAEGSALACPYPKSTPTSASTSSPNQSPNATKHQPMPRNRKPVPLTEFLLLHQLRMRSRDADAVGKVQASALAFGELLAIVANAKAKTKTGEALDLAELGRVPLGQVVRRAGQWYALGLQLALAKMVVVALVAERGGAGAAAVEALASGCGLSSDVTQPELISPFMSASATPTTQLPLPPTLVLPSLLASSPGATAAVAAAEYIVGRLDILGLHGAWQLQPLLDGAALKKVLPRIPQGPAFGQVRASLFELSSQHFVCSPVSLKSPRDEHLLLRSSRNKPSGCSRTPKERLSTWRNTLPSPTLPSRDVEGLYTVVVTKM